MVVCKNQYSDFIILTLVDSTNGINVSDSTVYEARNRKLQSTRIFLAAWCHIDCYNESHSNWLTTKSDTRQKVLYRSIYCFAHHSLNYSSFDTIALNVNFRTAANSVINLSVVPIYHSIFHSISCF